MPSAAASEIAQDLSLSESKSTFSKAIDAITPDFLVNLYYKLAKSDLSLTNKKEIEGFHDLVEALASFCDPSQPLNIDPDIAGCWRIFTYKKITASTYSFANPFQFARVNTPYQARQTIKGRTYWDFPFTSSILALAGSAPALKEGAKQSLPRLVFGYMTSVAVLASSFDSESKKFQAIEHLNQVIRVLVSEPRCRTLFNEKNTEVLVQMANRITHYFSVKHAEKEAAFIPESVEQLKRISREQASILFSMLLIATEGANKKSLCNDYHRIMRGHLNINAANPSRFTEDNPFVTHIKLSSALLNMLHDEPALDDELKHLMVPELMAVRPYIAANIVLANKGKSDKNALLYFFLQRIDSQTQLPVWMEEQDYQDQQCAAEQLRMLARWLKFFLTIAAVAKDLMFLLTLEGQQWIAQGEDARIIQQLMMHLQLQLTYFKAEFNQFHHFLRGRIRAKGGREHHFFKLVQTAEQMASLFYQKGVLPLLNIEERYLIASQAIPEVRKQLFERIISLLNQSQIGINITAPQRPLKTAVSLEAGGAFIFSSSISAGRSMHCAFSSQLIDWMDKAAMHPQQGEFLNFWRSLLYVEKDSGLIQGKKLPKLKHFHQQYLSDVNKLRKSAQLSNELLGFFKHPKSALACWAEQLVQLIYKQALAPSQFLVERIAALQSQIGLKSEQAEAQLKSSLDIIRPAHLAWDEPTFSQLKKTLTQQFGLSADRALYFLTEVSHQILQTSDAPDHTRLDALDEVLSVALTRLTRFSHSDKEKIFWRTMCRGLMILGASPLPWMDSKMAECAEVSEEDSAGFFMACQQATFLISNLAYRAKHFGETSDSVKEKLDAFLKALEAFGMRLYSCVSDDESWWWHLLLFFGFKNQGGARLARATLFWASVRWLYVSINEQLLLSSKEPSCTEAAYSALSRYEQAAQTYQLQVPKADPRYNQGFATWERLNTAFKAYLEALMQLALLRSQKTLALELDGQCAKVQSMQMHLSQVDKQLRHTEANIENLETQKKQAIERHVTLLMGREALLSEADMINEVMLVHAVEKEVVLDALRHYRAITCEPQTFACVA